MKISLKQFRDAMVIVETYSAQIEEKEFCIVSTIGARVKLSAYGLEAQGVSVMISANGNWPIFKKNHQLTSRLKKRIGKVVDYMAGAYPNQGTVTVKWEGIKKPDSMHESQVERI